MIDQRHNAPRRYFVDAQGHHVLIGLSLAETEEFEALDVSSQATFRIVADVDASEGADAADDVRWCELYSKHDGAWRVWIAQSRADRTQDLGFVNYA